jgi:hypothetical protein
MSKVTAVEQTLRQTQLEVSACQRPGRFACQLAQCLIQRRQVADASESRDFSVSNAGRPGSCPGRVTPLSEAKNASSSSPLPCTCSSHSAHRLHLNYGRGSRLLSVRQASAAQIIIVAKIANLRKPGAWNRTVQVRFGISSEMFGPVRIWSN